MSDVTTPAIERVARFLYPTLGGPNALWEVDNARSALSVALDVEEMARAAYGEGAWCGVCEYEGWDACEECRETLRGYARAIRRVVLGLESAASLAHHTRRV